MALMHSQMKVQVIPVRNHFLSGEFNLAINYRVLTIDRTLETSKLFQEFGVSVG